MLASNQLKNRLLNTKNHERFGRKYFSGTDSDGRGTDWSWGTQLRYLFAPAEGPDRFHRNANGRSHFEPGHCAVALSANGGFEKGHQHLHQFAWWLGHCGTRGV